MKRKNIGSRLIAGITFLTMLFTMVWPVGISYGYTEVSRTSTKEPVAEGVTIENFNINTTDGTVNAFVMSVDLTNPYVRVDTLAGTNNKVTSTKGLSKMAAEEGAVAAINGDFFQMGENAPIGVTVKSGEIVTSPSKRSDMYGFGLTKENKPIFTIFSFSGTVKSPSGVAFELSGINKPTYLDGSGVRADQNKLHMYTPRWGAKSRGPVTGLTNMVEVVVENDLVKEIRVNQPAVAIPGNGYVLAGHGTAGEFLTKNFKVQDKVEVNYKVSPESDNLTAAIGGQALLVYQGKRHWFTQNITGKRARTAIGATQDGTKLLMVVVQGGNGSRGMTQEELADFMLSLGAWTAVNLDGGGSSTMVARHLGDTNLSVLNVPVYESERAVPTGLGIFSTAPEGPLMGIKVSGPQRIIVGTKKSYSVKGYDIHYNPYQLNNSDVNWTVSSSKGFFQGNVFNAVYSGSAVITASQEGVDGTFPVTILGSPDISKLEVTPSTIALNPGNSTTLSVKVTTRQGEVFTLNPGEYQLNINGNVGTVNGNKFTAGTRMATGELEVKVDSTITKVRVSVGAIEKPLYDFETPRNLKFRGYPTGVVTGGFRLTNSNEPGFRGVGAARLDYDFTKTNKTRAGYGNFENGIVIPGQPLGLGLWVYGNNSGHWLRARITDADGTEKLVDFAQQVNWKGWKHVTSVFPSGLKYPVKLTDIYMVQTEGGLQDKGTVYFDELSMLCAPTEGDLSIQPPVQLTGETEALPGTPALLEVGQDFKAYINNPAGSATYSINARQSWDESLPTPGFNPLMPMYRVTAAANGHEIETMPGSIKLTFKIREAGNLDKVRVMLWNEKTASWILLPAKTDVKSATISAKTNYLGLFCLMEDAGTNPVFKDTGSSWAKETISQMAAKRIVKGFPDGTFLPGKGVSRAEFVTLVANTLGWRPENSEVSFKDSIPEWAKGNIGAAVNRGIVKGYSDGTFQPNKVITRAEMAVIIDKALALPKSNAPSAYKDASQIPSWAVQSIRNTKVAGLLKGSENNMFRPGDVANRAEATAVMSNILVYYLNL